MFSPDQSTHILPPSIWCITTPRYYFHGTTFIIRNQKCSGKNSAKGTSELRSTRPNFIPFLASRCLYIGVHLTTGQPDPKAHQMSRWPDSTALGHQMPVMRGYIWAQVSLTQRLTTCHADLMFTTLGHYMPLRGTSEVRWTRSDSVLSWVHLTSTALDH